MAASSAIPLSNGLGTTPVVSAIAPCPTASLASGLPIPILSVPIAPLPGGAGTSVGVPI